MNNHHVEMPGKLLYKNITLADLGSDNQSIQTIYHYVQSITDLQIKKDMETVLRLASDAFCIVCDDLGINPEVLDWWDGIHEYIVTPFNPLI